MLPSILLLPFLYLSILHYYTTLPLSILCKLSNVSGLFCGGFVGFSCVRVSLSCFSSIFLNVTFIFLGLGSSSLLILSVGCISLLFFLVSPSFSLFFLLRASCSCRVPLLLFCSTLFYAFWSCRGRGVCVGLSSFSVSHKGIGVACGWSLCGSGCGGGVAAKFWCLQKFTIHAGSKG